jgi:RHS repeat-associated protein
MQRSLLVLLAVILLPIVATAQTTQVVEYYHTDAQGNVRAVTRQVDGQWQVVVRYDYLPFGELFGQPSPPNQKRLFTGQERDFETGLDYFGARYFAASLGRFTTVDPGNASAALHDTQSWNAYAYGRNNPLRFIDLDGRTYQVCAVGSGCSFLSDAGWESAMGKAGGNYLLQNGNMWALVNGKWNYAGFYEHISDDPAPVTFDSFIHQTGNLASRWLKENVREMAIGSAVSAVGGAVSGALGGGLVAGGTAAGSDVTDLAVVTAKGARYANYATKLTAREFQSNLLANGYKIVRQGISSNGPFTVLSSGEKTFTIYTATSTGGASVQVRVAGQIVSKIRLGGF